MEEIDWVGKWFGILEELGEFPYVAAGKFSTDQSEPEWVFLPHEDYDGIGGFVHILRQEGYCIDRLPEMKDAKPPGLIRATLAFARITYENRVRHMPWKKYDPTQKGVFQGVAYHQFTAEETLKIRATSRQLGVSTNTLLFWSVDRAVLSLFRTTDFERRWMIPFNMRGGVKRPRETSNHSSYIGISIPNGATKADVQKRLQREIKLKSHWGGWYSILSGRYMGVQGMKKFLIRYRGKGGNWAGIFSNLGEWPLAGTEPQDPDQPTTPAWTGAVVVTQGHPIGAFCLTWRGRLGISLQFHRSLGLTRKEFEPFVDAWRAEILACLL